jgi:hypothetical protein
MRKSLDWDRAALAEVQLQSKSFWCTLIQRKQLDSAAEWMDLRTTQGYADVSERTLREWIHRPLNPLPAVQVEHGKILIKRSKFDQWPEAHPIQLINSIDVNRIADEIMNDFRKAA